MISTIIAVLLHQIHNDPLMSLNSKTQSLVVTSGLFPPIAFFALVMTFGIIGLIFIKIQKNLWGSKIRKGMVLGLIIIVLLPLSCTKLDQPTTVGTTEKITTMAEE